MALVIVKHRHQGGMALVLLQLTAPKQKQVPFYMACGLAILDRQ
jgi:hypothetical protein